MPANLFTIARRELNAYYTSAIAYITIIVFLSLTMGLYMAPFFTVLSADMRVFFTILPIALCVFLPAVSMRLWAEERKQNTWEMLLTFPMRAYEMTLGKFLASMVFYMSALAGTLVLPLMLVLLGDPDLGPIFGAYLGSLLLGAFFLSLGLFVSAMCRDQIVAFMLTLLGCFGFYLAGTELVVTLAEAAWPGARQPAGRGGGRHAALPDLHARPAGAGRRPVFPRLDGGLAGAQQPVSGHPESTGGP